jgi:hypothetical protein
MPNALWKIKAIRNRGVITQGMEVEVIVKNTSVNRPPEKDVKAAFEEKYGIKAPNGIWKDKSTCDYILL